MIQKVNLYQAQFKPPKEIFSLSHMAVTVALAFILFGVSSWSELSEINKLEKRVETTEMERSSIVSEIKKLTVEKADQDKAGVHESDVRAQENELVKRRELLHKLTDGSIGSTDGFSDYMLALARQKVEGAWITGLTVQQGGKKLAVAGSSMQPEMAPIYLQNLAKEQVFSGKIFSVMELSRKESKGKEGEETGADYVDFIFRTDDGKENEEGEVKHES